MENKNKYAVMVKIKEADDKTILHSLYKTEKQALEMVEHLNKLKGLDAYVVKEN